jgi:hypothetical protein
MLCCSNHPFFRDALNDEVYLGKLSECFAIHQIDPGNLTEEQRQEAGIEGLPSSFPEALQALEADAGAQHCKHSNGKQLGEGGWGDRVHWLCHCKHRKQGPLAVLPPFSFWRQTDRQTEGPLAVLPPFSFWRHRCVSCLGFRVWVEG